MTYCPQCGCEVYADESMCAWCVRVTAARRELVDTEQRSKGVRVGMVLGTVCWAILLTVLMWILGGNQ